MENQIIDILKTNKPNLKQNSINNYVQIIL